MTILKCKICGGDIELTGESCGYCDSCGSEVTLPKFVDEARIVQYNRANRLRANGEFDKAYRAFMNLVDLDKTDAEAHWNLLLCRYGVEYVEDKKTGEYKPTVSRMSFDSVWDDPSYQEILKYAAPETRAIYRSEVGKIAQIQARFQDICRSEEPYDVFICFKAEEKDGTRTEASVEAQKIYEHLTDKGLKVFFSRITLEGKLGIEYEPYIFAALHSARIMLVVADKPEQLTARWVQNEWRRFALMKEKDQSKYMMPVYVNNIDPYAFPAEFAGGQGQKMGELGALQNLTKNIMSRLGKREGDTLTVQKTFNVQNQMTRLQQDVVDGDFEEAEKHAEEILMLDPENGRAYLYQVLIANKVTSLQGLLDIGTDWEKHRIIRRAYQFGEEELRKELDAFYKECKKEVIYRDAKALFQEEKYKEALPMFEGLYEYRDSVKCMKKCREVVTFDNNMAAYRKEVGDGRTYLKEMLEKHASQQMEEYTKLCQKVGKADDWKGSFNILSFGVNLFMVIIIIIGLINGLNRLDNLLFGWILFTSIGIGLLVFMLPAAIGCFIVCFIILGIMQNFPLGQWIFMAAVTLIQTWYHSKHLKALMTYKSLIKKRENYYHTVILPLENDFRKQIEKEYIPLIGKENMVSLRSVKDSHGL